MPKMLQCRHAHDPKALIRRWRAVAKEAGLVLKKYGDAGGYDLYFLRSRKVHKTAPAIYLSAGIHGDEPGATEGLIAWAEKNPAALSELNLLIFPCLNPWGLVNNCRYDSEGRDLNRSYRNKAVPQIVRQMELFAKDRFDLAIMMHEDYDALGIYIYEILTAEPFWAETLAASAGKLIPCDPRPKIEGRKAKRGIMRPAIDPEAMPDWPEAFVLGFKEVRRVFTIETPSEFHLDTRAAAHATMLRKAVVLCWKEFAGRR